MPRKSEISFEVKKIIWDMAAKGYRDKYSAIQRHLDKVLPEQEFVEDTPDIRIIKRVINEDINELSPEVVVSELPRYVWELREDCESVKQLAESRAQAVEKRANPLIEEAQKEHLAEVRSLIEEWRDAVKTPRIDEMSLSKEGYLTLDFSEGEYQFNPLFECLDEHLTFPILWQNQSLWVTKIPDYFDSCKNLIKEIKEDNRVVKWLEQNPTSEENVILEPVLRCISDRALGKDPELLNHPDPDTGEIKPYMQVTAKPGSTKFIERKSPTVRREQFIIESVVYIDPAICSDYLDRQETTHIVDLFNEMRTLETKIQESLKEILSRRDYIVHTCRLCPTSTLAPR